MRALVHLSKVHRKVFGWIFVPGRSNTAILNDSFVEQGPCFPSIIRPVGPAARAYDVKSLSISWVQFDCVNAQPDRSKTPIDTPLISLRRFEQASYLLP